MSAIINKLFIYFNKVYFKMPEKKGSFAQLYYEIKTCYNCTLEFIIDVHENKVNPYCT
jgi:hypothetical protein